VTVDVAGVSAWTIRRAERRLLLSGREKRIIPKELEENED